MHRLCCDNEAPKLQMWSVVSLCIYWWMSPVRTWSYVNTCRSYVCQQSLSCEWLTTDLIFVIWTYYCLNMDVCCMNYRHKKNIKCAIFHWWQLSIKNMEYVEHISHSPLSVCLSVLSSLSASPPSIDKIVRTLPSQHVGYICQVRAHPARVEGANVLYEDR